MELPIDDGELIFLDTNILNYLYEAWENFNEQLKGKTGNDLDPKKCKDWSIPLFFKHLKGKEIKGHTLKREWPNLENKYLGVYFNGLISEFIISNKYSDKRNRPLIKYPQNTFRYLDDVTIESPLFLAISSLLEFDDHKKLDINKKDQLIRNLRGLIWWSKYQEVEKDEFKKRLDFLLSFKFIILKDTKRCSYNYENKYLKTRSELLKIKESLKNKELLYRKDDTIKQKLKENNIEYAAQPEPRIFVDESNLTINKNLLSLISFDNKTRSTVENMTGDFYTPVKGRQLIGDAVYPKDPSLSKEESNKLGNDFVYQVKQLISFEDDIEYGHGLPISDKVYEKICGIIKEIKSILEKIEFRIENNPETKDDPEKLNWGKLNLLEKKGIKGKKRKKRKEYHIENIEFVDWFSENWKTLYEDFTREIEKKDKVPPRVSIMTSLMFLGLMDRNLSDKNFGGAKFDSNYNQLRNCFNDVLIFSTAYANSNELIHNDKLLRDLDNKAKSIIGLLEHLDEVKRIEQNFKL